MSLVMIIEDDKDIRESVSEVLAVEGYQVVAVSHGREGLDYLKSGDKPRPDAIVLDLMMPVMNGMQFRSEQLADSKISAIPLIVMSADNRATQKSAEMKSATCILKPLEIDDLLVALKRVIKH